MIKYGHVKGGTIVGSCSINTNLSNNALECARHRPIINGNSLTPCDNQKRCKVTRFKGSLSDDRLIKCRNKFLDIEEELCATSHIVRMQTPLPTKHAFLDMDDCDDNEISPPPPLPITNPPPIPIRADLASSDDSDEQSLSAANDVQLSDDLSPKIENFSVKFEKTVCFAAQSSYQDEQQPSCVSEQEFRPIQVSESTENLARIVRPIAVYPNGSLSKSVQDLSTIDRDQFLMAPLTMTRSSDDLLLPDIDGLRRPLTAKQKYAKHKRSQEDIGNFANGKPLPLPRSSLLGVNGASKKLVYVLDRSKNEFVLEEDGALMSEKRDKIATSKLKLSFCGFNSEDSDDEPYTMAKKQSVNVESRQILPKSLEESSRIVPVLKSNSIFYVHAPTTSRCKL